MDPDKKFSVIIVAGGKGVRAGGEMPKQFVKIGGKPMIMHTIEAFHKFDNKIRIIVVLPEGLLSFWLDLCNEYKFKIRHQAITGGETRFHSVKNGLDLVLENETVGIHDGARPFITTDLIERCFNESYNNNQSIIPVIDEFNSVRQLTNSGSHMIDRSKLKIVQTPQVFPGKIIKSAYSVNYNNLFTDDASVVEKNGSKVRLVEGEVTNIKITTTIDLELANCYLQLLAKR